MNQAYLLLGSNIGNRLKWLQTAVLALEHNLGRVLQLSPVYETAAWGKEDQALFLNQVVLLETNLDAPALLQGLQQIERETAHRERKEKWAARTLDMDILFFNRDVIHLPGLSVPHPHLHERRFALTPLADVAPQYCHPVLQQTVTELLEQCKDPLVVQLFDELPANL